MEHAEACPIPPGNGRGMIERMTGELGEIRGTEDPVQLNHDALRQSLTEPSSDHCRHHISRWMRQPSASLIHN
jgi:hypothetical protein